MRVESKTIYRYSELDQEARDNALEQVRERLYEWIESDDLSEVMIESLGYGLGQHDGGQGQGLRGIELDEWAIDRNGRDYLRISGTLTRETAPNLPWPEDVGYVRLGRVNLEWTGSDRDAWLIDTETGAALYPEWMADRDRDDVRALFDKLDDIIGTALESGCSEYDYLCSEEHARDWIDANDPEVFDADGDWT